MKEWTIHNSGTFSLETPKNWVSRQLPDGPLVMTDPSSSVTLTVEFAAPEFQAVTGESGRETLDELTASVVSPREAQNILQRWISRFSNVRPLTPPRQILGTNHMTCTADGLGRPETSLGRLKDFIQRSPHDSWRFWAIFDRGHTVLARSNGSVDAMQFLAPVLEAIISTLNILAEPSNKEKPFVQMVVELGREHVPPNEISAIDDETLNLGGMKIRINTLQQLYQQEPEKLTDNVRDFFDKLLVRSATESTSPEDWEHLSGKVMPVLLPEQLAERLNHDVIQQDWLTGIKIHYEIPGANMPITLKDIRRWGIDTEELENRASRNLLRATRNMQMNGGHYERYTLFNFTRTNAFNSSRILLPILYRNLREHLGNTFYIAIPDRDVLMAFATQDESVLDWMRNQVRLKFSHATHPLSDRLFLATPDGIAEVECHSTAGRQTAG